MATDYMVGDAKRPPATPMGPGPGCFASWRGYGCTLDRGHDGTHIADGISARCAEWEDGDEE